MAVQCSVQKRSRWNGLSFEEEDGVVNGVKFLKRLLG